jgi:5-methylcytosine-specific restriction protein A
MATLPALPCAHRGCPELQPCSTHRQRYDRDLSYERKRGSSGQRLYDYRWQQARAHFLDRHPLCQLCHAEGRITAATAVDHRTPHRGNSRLFWDETNWQALCERCHNRKSRQERLT